MSNADGVSDCSSYSYSPEYKNYIDEEHGSSLFFIKTHPIDHLKMTSTIASTSALNNHEAFRNQFSRMSLRKREKGILSKFTSKKPVFDFKVIDRNRYEHVDGVLKELKIGNKTGKVVKPKHGDKRSLFEIMFNATIINAPDKKRFLIDTINPSSVFEKDLSIGDYLKSIEGEIILAENLSSILRKVQGQKHFKIVAQECNSDDFDGMHEEIKMTKITDIVEHKEKLFNLPAESHELIFSLNIIVKNEQNNEDSGDFTTVYSYPPQENNFLHKLKGAFLTIGSLVKNNFNSYPTSTDIKVHNTIFHITYTIRNGDNEFIFLGFNSNYAQLFDAEHLNKNFVSFLDYIYPNLFIENEFDQLTGLCEMMKIQLMNKTSSAINFEQQFALSKFVSLPKEIVLRINDALSELEAMDYRNWNESLMELFGKFFIIGSCVYYKTSLICSHFNTKDMENVELFLRHMCIKSIFESCVMKEVAIFQRVFPRDYQSFNMENDSAKNKVFLLAAARGNLMICVVLEENGYSVNPEVEIQSSNYLIHFLEEMEDVVDHLKFIGVENLTKIWINSAKRPVIRDPMDNSDEKKGDDYALKNIQEENEDDEGSLRDFDSHVDSGKSSIGFDNEEEFYKDYTDIIPQTLTFGHENVLYHYTQLDFAEGIVLTSIDERSSRNEPNEIILNVFRKACLQIHKMFQNTIKFNQMLLDEKKIAGNKNVLAPKEQGLQMDVKIGDKTLKLMIVGRLIGTKELFVCYDAKIPQNIIEMAFRLGLNTAG